MRQFWIGAISGIALVGVVGIVAVPGHSSAATNSETYDQLNLFGQVFERVRADYVEKPDDAKLVESAVNGMLAGLDPHSSYMDAKSFRDMQVQTRGEFGGLGIEVTMEEGLIKVVSPIDDTPASKAGVMANDIITKLDDVTVCNRDAGTFSSAASRGGVVGLENRPDGDAAMEWLQHHRPDLVVLDWTMPGLNGDEVCRFIRSYPPTADVPVIILTASRTESDDAVTALECGANDYVSKPFVPQVLRARLEQLRELVDL